MSQLTNKNLKKFMEFYSTKMESKKQTPTPSIRSNRSSRATSRSRSRSKPRARFSTGKNKRRNVSQSMGKLIKTQSLKSIKPVLDYKAQSDKKLALAKSGYFGDTKDNKVDVPSLQKENDQLVRELQLAVAAVRAGLKDKPVRMRLSAELTIITTVSTGVTNTIKIGGSSAACDPSLCTEWATCALLFEEFKNLGGSAHFVYVNPIKGDTDTTNQSSNSLPVIAYDADDSTAATSSIALTQASQHKILTPLLLPSSAGGTVLYSESGPIKHNFNVHTPRGFAEGGTISATPGTEWMAVAGVQPSGWLKFYHIGAGVTAKTTGAGVYYFDLEFRCRS